MGLRSPAVRASHRNRSWKQRGSIVCRIGAPANVDRGANGTHLPWKSAMLKNQA
jgi:hypothetical protein